MEKSIQAVLIGLECWDPSLPAPRVLQPVYLTSSASVMVIRC